MMLLNLQFKLFISIPILLIFSTFNLSPPVLSENRFSLSQKQIDLKNDGDFSQHFDKLGVEGSIIIYDSKLDQTFEHNSQRNITPFPVASTFKILNSLIALETAVIRDEIAVLTWDGVERSLPVWNRDLNLKEAFQISGVWFYQVLARRIGYNQMTSWIKKVDYGNNNTGNPEDIDQFWLNGKLQITPQQQIQFLRRLHHNDLPFADRTISIVKDIMINEKTPDYTIRSKTGWFGYGNPDIQNIGWYVGYVETKNNVYFFATNIDIKQEKDGIARLELTRLCLEDLGVFAFK
ncbi:class D beta-lactamase [Geminocystis herdmanii]|uniref:class D beta-lactamase n=1 Tax=Geminocystis herdmanii TaxID=669359 RepID=UPI001181873C|nr:class D beta-lactamase [Geminocystis herdmanii]